MNRLIISAMLGWFVATATVAAADAPPNFIVILADNLGAVLQPVSPKGLHPDEVTIAEVLEPAGHATARIGKWHLGDRRLFLPTRHGFDEYFGIPYSDDMTADKSPDGTAILKP